MESDKSRRDIATDPHIPQIQRHLYKSYNQIWDWRQLWTHIAKGVTEDFPRFSGVSATFRGDL